MGGGRAAADDASAQLVVLKAVATALTRLEAAVAQILQAIYPSLAISWAPSTTSSAANCAATYEPDKTDVQVKEDSIAPAPRSPSSAASASVQGGRRRVRSLSKVITAPLRTALNPYS